MDYRIVWIHGIGPIKPGYSQDWDKAYNPYLNFPLSDFIEVYWADIFSSMMKIVNLGTNMFAIPFATQEELIEAQVRKTLTTVLLARMTAAQVQNDAFLGEWSQVAKNVASGQAALPPWLSNLDAYIGEFVKYLVYREIRTAVKGKAKAQLRLLANRGYNSSIIAHSWGTVVAYESLLDLETEMPEFQLAHLFTLGSPLWLVQYLLDDSSGRKPRNVANWINIHARGDIIGAGLTPGFQDDADYEVASFGSGDPHGSYFVDGNVAVEHDLVAVTILGH